MDHPPLHWWSVHRHFYPNLSKLACKCLCVVATSVPSEQFFSIAGNVVSVKCAALLPENVEKLIFFCMTIFHQCRYLTSIVYRKKVRKHVTVTLAKLSNPTCTVVV